MTKIGNSSIGSEGGNEKEELSPWQKFVISLVDGNADRWFEKLDPTPVSKVYSKELYAMGSIPSLLSYTAKEDLNIVPVFDLTNESDGEICEIPETSIGAAVLAELNTRGVEMNYRTQWPVSHEVSIELDIKTQLEGQWGTEFGTPFIQCFQVSKDAAGKFFGYWFVDLLASPVPLESWNTVEYGTEDGVIEEMRISDAMLEDGGFTVGELSTKLQLPTFVKQLAYMCETPFPSTQIMSMSRTIAFSGVPEEAWPTPFFALKKNGLLLGYSRSRTMEAVGKQNFYDGCLFPDVIRFGWRFSDDSIDYIQAILPLMADGCSAAMTIVEDGFENFRALDYPAPWDDVVGSPCNRLANYETTGSRLGAPQWIPNTHVGEIVSETTRLASQHSLLVRQGSHFEAEQLSQQILNDGAGASLVHMMNTYLYATLIPLLPEDPSKIHVIERLAGQAIEMEMEGQSTNAMCNLGTAYFIIGDLESAEEVLMQTLERSDNFSEAEACHVLALVYEQMGDEDKALVFRTRSQSAGGFDAPDWLDRSALRGKATSQSKVATQTGLSFCGNCGCQFQRIDQKFCMSCGERR